MKKTHVLEKDRQVKLSSLGKRLYVLRKERGLSLKELALCSGIDKSKISKIEKGLINITVITVWSLCEGMEISPKVLFDEKGLES